MPEALFLLSGYAKARMLDMLVDILPSICPEARRIVMSPLIYFTPQKEVEITLLAWGSPSLLGDLQCGLERLIYGTSAGRS